MRRTIATESALAALDYAIQQLEEAIVTDGIDRSESGVAYLLRNHADNMRTSHTAAHVAHLAYLDK